MKTRKLLALVCAMVISLAVGTAQAQTTYTRQNNTTLLNAAGAWDAGGPPTGVDIAKWDSTCGANVGTALGGNVTWGQILITNPGGAITIANTASSTLTLNGVTGTGIDMSAANQNLTINNPVTLGGAQTWNVGSGRTLTVSQNYIINNGGFLLTIDGSGSTTWSAINQTTATLTGAGGLTKNGSGRFSFAGNNTGYSGTTTLNGGVTTVTGVGSIGSGNLTLNGGVYEEYWTADFTRTLGSDPGKVQILGGESGFSENGSTGMNLILNNSAAFEVVWDSAFFSPSTLVLQAPSAQNSSSLNFQNKVDLNGATRTVKTSKTTGSGAGSATMSGVIRTSSGTAGLTKTGDGTLVLSGANTFNGQLTVENGTLSIGSINNVSANGVLGNSALSVLLGASGQTGALRYTGGTASSTKPFTLATSGAGAFDISTAATILTLSGNIDGSGDLAKNGTGTLTLSGNNNYGGITTVNAGTLAIAKQASLASNTAANLNVKNGATLALNVDSAGTAGFDSTALNTLLGNISVANTAAQGLQGGAILAFDTATASGATFTQGNAITDSTGAFGGAISLKKLGAGTLVLDKDNTYTGPTTTSAGTLRLDDGGSIAGSLVNNSVFLVNKTGGVTRGTDFPALIGGSGSTALGASTTFTISTPDQFLFSALNTTGGGSIILSGVSTPVFGGLSGATGDLGTISSSGYGSVTALTLNVPSGLTFTYGGVIADGAAGMSLTKTGAGTQILTGNNTYTGITYLNGGALHVGTGSTIGKLSGTTGLTFNGGTLQFNRSSNANIDAINDAATITVNSSSTFGVTSADAGGASANETIGAVTLNAGQMNFNWSNGGSSGTLMTLTNLSRSGTASANFNSGFASNNSRWKLAGAGTTPAGQIIGPWYTTGGNNAGFASTDYAVYSSDFVAQAAIAGSAENTWTTADNAYTTSAGGTVNVTGTRTITALRNTGATTVLTLASGANLETYGLLNGVSTLLTVAPGTGGVLTTPSGSGNTNLYVNAGAGAITVNAPINNNGVIVTLVKNGANTLTLGSMTSDYSGGTVINTGTVAITNNLNLGPAGTAITFNGSATLASSLNTAVIDLGSRPITLTNGAVATFAGIANVRADFTIGGAVTGSGGVNVSFLNFWGKFRFSSTANTFTGPITDSRPSNDGIANALFSFNSIADGVGYGNIILNSANDSGIDYGSGAIAPLNLDNRQLILANNNTVFFNNASSQAVNINTDIGFSGTGARQIRFGINGRSGSGISTLAGKLTDNVGGAFTPTFNGGTWVLSGTSTYSGVTTVSAGMLSINSLANVNGGACALGTPSSVANGTISIGSTTTAGTLQYTGSGHTSDRVINLAGTTGGVTLDASGTGPLVLTSALTATGAGSKTLTLTGDSTATNTLGGAVVDNSGANKTTLIKTNIGIWVLSGSNTYTGTTIVRVGTLMGVTGGACASSAVIVTNTPGNISALGIRVTDTNLPWSCSSLAFTTNGLGAQLMFSFATAPSKTLAPLSITGNLVFTGAPVIVVSTANVPPGKYPLLVGGGTTPSAIPALDLMGSTMKGTLSWGGTDNKTLYLSLQSTGTFISLF
jgi:autotransporter-associated beta strand protein